METEEKTAELEAEKQVGEENPETPVTPTDENAEADAQAEAETSENQEGENFYEQQLKFLEEENKRLQEEAAERERQIEIKDRAIRALKKPHPVREPASPDDRETLKQELLGEVEAKWQRKEAQRFIETVTADKTERDVFLRHYEKLPSKTGDIEKDVFGAIASANAPRILDLLGRGRAEDESDDRSISSMRGEGVRPPATRIKTAFEKEVEKMIPKEARKYLKNHIPR